MFDKGKCSGKTYSCDVTLDCIHDVLVLSEALLNQNKDFIARIGKTRRFLHSSKRCALEF